jgi:hypothetical protein
MTTEIDYTTGEPVWVFPFESMSVGDSFFIPTLKTANMLYVVDTRAKEAKIRVKAFVTVYDGILGVRVWRTG